MKPAFENSSPASAAWEGTTIFAPEMRQIDMVAMMHLEPLEVLPEGPHQTSPVRVTR